MPSSPEPHAYTYDPALSDITLQGQPLAPSSSPPTIAEATLVPAHDPPSSDNLTSPKAGSRRPPPSPLQSPNSFPKPAALAVSRPSAYKRARTLSPIIDDYSSDLEQERRSVYSQTGSELGDYEGNEAPVLQHIQLAPTPLRESYSSSDLGPLLRHNDTMSSSEDKTIEGLMTEKLLSLDDQSARAPESAAPFSMEEAELGSQGLPSYSDAMGQSIIDSVVLSSMPSGQEQLKTIKPMKNQPLVAGETWYLVSREWYKRWSTACSQDGQETSADDAITAGPIDNRSLLSQESAEDGRLKNVITEGVDYEMLPEEGWRLLESWYGVDGPVFARQVVEGINPGQESVEFYPPKIQLLKLVVGEATQGSRVPLFTMSSSRPFSELKAETKRLLGLGEVADTDIRYWLLSEPTDDEIRQGVVDVSRTDDEDVEAVEAKEKNALLYNPDVSLKELGLDEMDMSLAAEVKSQGRWTTDPASRASASTTRNLFAQQGGDFFTNLQQGTASALAESAVGLLSATGTDRVTRSQTANQKSDRVGLRGLNNLGNTCFMNSALQCLSNTFELQQYFVSGVYKQELNTDNPLGMGGAIAEAFGSLIQNLWNGQGGTFWPREFKYALARFAPQFSGYAQHDTQELLAFLLDGLHEDLNRIIKKPYIEAPDWEGGGERDMVAFAKKQWDIYKARNDSVIVDLFQGQYRSTLVCPVCSKVSIKFDPFMYLTLPIPNERKWRCPIYFVPYGSNKPITKLAVQLPAGSNVGKLKQKVATHFGVETKRLVCGEIWHHSVFKWYDDYEPVIDIKAADFIYFWELPLDVKLPKKKFSHRYNRDVAEAEEGLQVPEEDAILPVYTNIASDAGGSSSRAFTRRFKDEATGVPFFISVPKAQLNDPEAIQKIVIEKYKRFSDKPDDLMAYAEQQQAQKSAASVGAIQDWEMVDGVTPANDATVEIVEALQPQETSVVTEIREDGEAVEVVDVVQQEQPTPSETPIIVEKPTDAADAEESKPGEASRPLFSIRFTAADENQILPQGEAPENMTEELNERLARLTEASARQALQGANLGSDDSAAILSPPGTPDSDGKGKAQDVASASDHIPLVYTGGAIICTWSSAASEAYLIKSDKHQLWGEYADDMGEDFAKDSVCTSAKAKALSIEDCMDEFTKEEQLGEDDPWYCPTCKDFRQAIKKFDLWKVPDILVVHLKRFSAGRHSRDKLNVNIDFPLENLDLSERVEGAKAIHRLQKEADDNGETLGESVLGSGILSPVSDNDDAVATDAPVYDLYAVDNHFGGLGGGHYTAYAKNPADGKWYEFDDSSVRPVSNPDRVKTESAYLLFYRRRTTRPIGGKSRQKFQQAVREKAAKAVAAAALAAVVEPDQAEQPYEDADEAGPMPTWSPGRVDHDEFDMFTPDNASSFAGGDAGSSTGAASARSSIDE